MRRVYEVKRVIEPVAKLLHYGDATIINTLVFKEWLRDVSYDAITGAELNGCLIKAFDREGNTVKGWVIEASCDAIIVSKVITTIVECSNSKK